MGSIWKPYYPSVNLLKVNQAMHIKSVAQSNRVSSWLWSVATNPNPSKLRAQENKLSSNDLILLSCILASKQGPILPYLPRGEQSLSSAQKWASLVPTVRGQPQIPPLLAQTQSSPAAESMMMVLHGRTRVPCVEGLVGPAGPCQTGLAWRSRLW